MEWKEYNNRYLVSEYGDVKNIKSGRLLKPDLHYKGYLRVFANTSHTKRMYLHRLVAILYISNPDSLPQVNHIDGNKLNNHISNLEWCTNQYNQEHAFFLGLRKKKYIKLTEDQVINIKSSNKKAAKLAKEYSVATITIYKIRSGDIWSSVRGNIDI